MKTCLEHKEKVKNVLEKNLKKMKLPIVRFELTTPCLQDKCSKPLSYTGQKYESRMIKICFEAWNGIELMQKGEKIMGICG